MPFLNHNAPWLIDALKYEATQTRQLLRKLRHVIEQGHVEAPPLAIISELGRHASLLSHSIEQFTIRHDLILDNGKLHHSEYVGVMSFVAIEAHRDPLALVSPAYHAPRISEHVLYRELGFSEREYRDLQMWKKGWDVNRLDLAGAFNHFSDKVVAELQAARYAIKIDDIVPGVAGIVGIALDVIFFISSKDVRTLVSSCSTGMAAIAVKFPEVRRKLFERGR